MDEKTTACPLCAVMPMLEKCVPEEARLHLRNSRVEFLKALRSLLDERIAHLSREAGADKGTHVPVD